VKVLVGDVKETLACVKGNTKVISKEDTMVSDFPPFTFSITQVSLFSLSLIQSAILQQSPSFIHQKKKPQANKEPYTPPDNRFIDVERNFDETHQWRRENSQQV
jgi:hypothetical protein